MKKHEQQDALMEQSLRTYYQLHLNKVYGPEPEASEIMKQIEGRTGSQSQPLHWWQQMFRSQRADTTVIRAGRARQIGSLSLRVISGILIVVLLMSGGAYAWTTLDPILRSLLSVPVAKGEFTTIHQSKTINSVIITVEEAAMREDCLSLRQDKCIVIGYIVEKPVKSYKDWSFLNPPTLTTSDGTELKMMVGDSDDSQSGKNNKLRQANVAYYDAEGIKGNPSNLKLHMVFTLVSDKEQSVAFDFSIPYNQ